MFPDASKTEGLGTSLLDALAAGVPVISTKGGGIPEIVIHSKTGLLSEARDFRSLGDQVNQILDNKRLVDSTVSSGLKYVKNFSHHSMADKTFEEYLSIINFESN